MHRPLAVCLAAFVLAALSVLVAALVPDAITLRLDFIFLGLGLLGCLVAVVAYITWLEADSYARGRAAGIRAAQQAAAAQRAKTPPAARVIVDVHAEAERVRSAALAHLTSIATQLSDLRKEMHR